MADKTLIRFQMNPRQPGKTFRPVPATQNPGGFVVMLLLVFMALGPGVVRSSQAADITLDLSAGYTSNPSEEPQGRGSGFSEYSAGLSRELSPGDGAWTLGFMPGVTFQDLWDLEDNYTLGADVMVSPRTPMGRFAPGVFVSGNLFRDGLVEADERNEVALGARVDWFASALSSLSLEAAWKRVRYLSQSPPLSHGRSWKAMGSPMPGHGMGNGMGGGTTGPGTPGLPFTTPLPARDDRDLNCTAAIELFLRPNLTGTLSLDYGDRNSSLDMESYRQLTPSVNVVWLFLDSWQATMDVAVEYRNYHDLESSLATAGQAGSVRIRETNETRTMVVELRRMFDSLAVFARYGVSRGEYPLNDESYTQQIIQCGIVLSY